VRADPVWSRPTGGGDQFDTYRFDTYRFGADRFDGGRFGADRFETEAEVLVLGPVGVAGAARPFCRAWSLDLVVYLALHRHGVTTDTWATALWPDRLMAPATLHSTVSCARRSLGRSASGSDHLPRRRGSLRLAASVGCDWERFVALSRAEDPESWRRALGLVRGRPFEGLRSSDWTVFEGIAAEVEESVVALALRIGERCLVAGDGSGAAAAARRGLVASPFDERLYRLLLRAADCQGNPAGVEAAMVDLAILLGAELGGELGAEVGGEVGGGVGAEDRAPLANRALLRAPVGVRDWRRGMDYVHPETAALYRSLTRRTAVGPTDTREAPARL